MQKRPSLFLFVEGLVMIVASSLAIRFVPFARLMRTIGPSAGASYGSPSPALLRDIRRVLEAWSRRLPWRSQCYEQGLACLWMLDRRRLAATLYYGAALTEGHLKAHVWVRSGDRDVVGCENASDFALLSQFSNDSSSSPVQP